MYTASFKVDFMRIWSIHPQYLDWMGLGAQWREALLAQKVLLGETKGWRNHPQLNRFKIHPEPLGAVGYYLLEIYRESKKRGYNYNYTKILMPVENIEKILITSGQIEYEFKLLLERLERRSPEKYKENLYTNYAQPHPLFKIREGMPEQWEKSYWNQFL
jgi:hypothetical protein